MILSTASKDTGALPACTTTRPTASGVMKMPSRLEAEALHTAAGTLPRAIEVNAMADCTVAGRQHRNMMPRYSSRRHQRGQDRLEQQPDEGKQDEGRREDQAAGAPVRDAGDDGFTRQPGPMQEEQQADGDVGDVVEDRQALPVRRKQAGDDDGGDQEQREAGLAESE